MDLEDFTSKLSEDDVLNDTLDDVEDIDGEEVEQSNLDFVDMENEFAYLPCAAHNFQLVF